MKPDSFKQLFAFAWLKNRFDPRKVTFGKQILCDRLLKKMKGGKKKVDWDTLKRKGR